MTPTPASVNRLMPAPRPAARELDDLVRQSDGADPAQRVDIGSSRGPHQHQGKRRTPSALLKPPSRPDGRLLDIGRLKRSRRAGLDRIVGAPGSVRHRRRSIFRPASSAAARALRSISNDPTAIRTLIDGSARQERTASRSKVSGGLQTDIDWSRPPDATAPPNSATDTPYGVRPFYQRISTAAVRTWGTWDSHRRQAARFLGFGIHAGDDTGR